jgi:para-nitrobenzyl esterase
MSERGAATKVAELLLAELGLGAAQLPDIQNVSTDRILSAYFAATAKYKGGGGLGSGAFSPVLDPEVLPAHPFDPAATRISEDVPVMVGWNKTESTVFSVGDPQVFSLDEEGLRKRISALVGKETDALIKAYRTEFPKLSPSGIYFYVSSYSMMGSGSVKIAERKAALGRAPAYLYRLDWETPIFGGKFLSPHGLEMPMVFDNVEGGGAALTGGGSEAKNLAAKMSEAWIAFAAAGNPNSKKSGLPKWEPYDSAKRATMVFNNECRVAFDPQKEQREIFDRAAK